jgi:hypothetical protein
MKNLGEVAKGENRVYFMNNSDSFVTQSKIFSDLIASPNKPEIRPVDVTNNVKLTKDTKPVENG